MSFARYAIYYVPTDPALAGFGAAWLGWDLARACGTGQPDLPELAKITEAPRRYGFHGTLKPPFRMAEGQDRYGLDEAVAAMAADCAPARCDGLELSAMGRFLALTPVGDAAGLARVAATCVSALDPFRASATEAELAHRRQAHLSERQRAHLDRWGYPHVMEDFRFHLTLTGKLPKGDISRWTATVRAYLPVLPSPFVLDRIALVGERADGRFELIRSYVLTGKTAA